VRLRSAAAADAGGIAALLREAFRGDAEAELVAKLRADGDIAIELIAQEAGAIAGHVALSTMHVGGARTLALAPLAVVPARRRRGIGAELVRRALALAGERNESWCLLLGDPAYYAQFGFRANAAALVTGVPWAGHPAFQALRLRADAPPLAGEARYACAFGCTRPENADR
jgi:putative acetyltransferase